MIEWPWFVLVGFIFVFLVVRFGFGFVVSLLMRRAQQKILLHVEGLMNEAKKDRDDAVKKG